MVRLSALALRPPETPAEWVAVARIRAATGMTPKHPGPRARDHGSDRQLLVLVEDGRVIGTLRIDWLDARRAAFRRVAIAPDQQNRGLGAAMLRLAEDITRAHGRSQVVLHAKAASIGFYRAEGYSPIAWDEAPEDATSVNMGKDLAAGLPQPALEQVACAG